MGIERSSCLTTSSFIGATRFSGMAFPTRSMSNALPMRAPCAAKPSAMSPMPSFAGLGGHRKQGGRRRLARPALFKRRHDLFAEKPDRVAHQLFRHAPDFVIGAKNVVADPLLALF